MLIGLTAVAGMVDAVSFLSLGHVFVANMTGNVAFVGLALARAPGFSATTALVAIGGFLAGAGLAGRVARRVGRDRPVLLASGVFVEVILVAGTAVLAAVSSEPFGSSRAQSLAALAAAAMGVQNAVARQLAVPDLTTTVLTTTLSGIAADVTAESRERNLPRRVLAVGSLLAGALVGAVIDLHVGAAAALAVVAGVLAAVFVSAVLASRRPGDWRR